MVSEEVVGLSHTNEILNSTYLKLNPNPSQYTVQLGFNEVPRSVTIFDLQGKEILEATDLGSNMTLDVSSLEEGAYVLMAHLDEGRVARRFDVVR